MNVQRPHPIPVPSWLERNLLPNTVLAGAFVAFLACCFAGQLAGQMQHFAGFRRFHLFLSAETLYYPTVNQVRQLARAHIEPDRIAVIVGGSSILHGTGQPVEKLWTDRLQECLGPRFRVLNLGLRSARTNEFGAVAAEVLRHDFPKLLFVSDITPGVFVKPDGNTHRYFYWDAQARGLLIDDPLRAQVIEAGLEQAARDEAERGKAAAGRTHGMTAEAQRELRGAMQLDRSLAFRDLWTSVAYHRISTVWTRFTSEAFTRPRSAYQDAEPEPRPLELRYRADSEELALRQMRHLLQTTCGLGSSSPGVEFSHGKHWRLLDEALDANFPASTRARTLICVMRYSPYRLAQLREDEHEWYERVVRRYAEAFRVHGFDAAAIGRDWNPADYSDSRHLTPEGGAKLAFELAPRLRAMAAKLGYLPN
jgi:hypothetical protein